jgi:acyl transferase domain-containing protein/acyl carrier protein
MERLERKLEANRIASVRLASRNAFHTPLMADAAKAFRRKVESVPRRAPSIPWLSNVTGTWIEPTEAQSPQYWGNQILARVRFTQNLAALAEQDRFLIEVGPGEALIGIARQQMATSVTAPSLGAENRRKSDGETFLEAAAKAWECGTQLSWSTLQPESKGRRVALPTYPFERQRYWVESNAPSAGKAAEPKPNPPTAAPKGTKRPDIASWFYAPSWQSTPPASVVLRQADHKIDCWLILLDRQGLGEALAAELKREGAEVITVSVADGFAHTRGRFSLNPSNPGDYDQLWQGIAEQSLRPTGLVNLWTTSGMGIDPYDSLVLLLQAARPHRQRFRQIEIITDGLESVTGEPIHAVQRAEASGLARVIPLEYAGAQCRRIDLQLSEENLEQSSDQLLKELAAPAPGLTIAYRQGIRWQKGWMPAPLQEPSNPIIRSGGVYLITGGVGGIGYAIARHLLQHHQARVLLTGRTALPLRSERAAWIESHPADDSVTLRIRRLQELEQLGGEVRFLAADVSSREAMTEVLADARQHFGKIDGVFHAAGLAGGSTIASQNIAEAAALRRPKVQGSIVLAELLAGENLDFFLLCSSISAVAPAPSQGAYAAANAFQNYFAEYCRTHLKLPAIAVGFDAWREVGMAAEMVLPTGFESVKEERLRTAMTMEEGIEVIRRVLANWRGPQILTTTVDLAELLDQKPSEPVSETHEDASPQLHGAELTAILEIWRELLGNDAIAPSDNFFELGGHSLMGTMVAARIRDRFGIVLTLRTLFEAPTPESLAEAIRNLRETAPPEPIPVTLPGEEREEFEI